jgi:hypothetical protein
MKSIFDKQAGLKKIVTRCSNWYNLAKNLTNHDFRHQVDQDLADYRMELVQAMQVLIDNPRPDPKQPIGIKNWAFRIDTATGKIQSISIGEGS